MAASLCAWALLAGRTFDEIVTGGLDRDLVGGGNARGRGWRYTPQCMARTRLTCSAFSMLTRCFAGEISVIVESGMPSCSDVTTSRGVEVSSAPAMTQVGTVISANRSRESKPAIAWQQPA